MGHMGDVRVAGQTVAALVVTWNRKHQLARCLEAIRAQTRPVDRIFVVDNCSTDGTPELMSERGYSTDPNVEYVRLTENVGPGGGFHTGMELAYERGYDWIWTVDDDGAPLPDALERLFECPEHILVRGSVVVGGDDPAGEGLAYSLQGPSGVARKTSELALIGARDGILEGRANPWNGVAFSRGVVKRVGLPKKEFFYRYVETEYFLRIRRAGIPVGTVLAARVLHPLERQRFRRINLGFLTFSLASYDDPFLHYLYIRNSAYTLFRYYGPLNKRFLKLLVYPFVFPRRAAISSRALSEGVIGRFLPPDRVRDIVCKLR